MVSSNKRSGIQRRDDRAEQGGIGSRSSLPWRARGSQSLCRIWVQLGSNNASRGFLWTPKLAVSAVGFQSVTFRGRLDTVEVRSSSLLVPTIFLPAVPAGERSPSSFSFCPRAVSGPCKPFGVWPSTSAEWALRPDENKAFVNTGRLIVTNPANFLESVSRQLPVRPGAMFRASIGVMSMGNSEVVTTGVPRTSRFWSRRCAPLHPKK